MIWREDEILKHLKFLSLNVQYDYRIPRCLESLQSSNGIFQGTRSLYMPSADATDRVEHARVFGCRRRFVFRFETIQQKDSRLHSVSSSCILR